jgi:hypothetical protein
MTRGCARRCGSGNRVAGRIGAASDHEGKPGTGGIFPPPRPFWWLPVNGERHAIYEYDRLVSTGELVHTLCGAAHERPVPPTDAQWLWRTCEPCWNEACKIVGTG